jgi:hypothetical protein
MTILEDASQTFLECETASIIFPLLVSAEKRTLQPKSEFSDNSKCALLDPLRQSIRHVLVFGTTSINICALLRGLSVHAYR